MLRGDYLTKHPSEILETDLCNIIVSFAKPVNYRLLHYVRSWERILANYSLRKYAIIIRLCYVTHEGRVILSGIFNNALFHLLIHVLKLLLAHKIKIK